MGPCAVDDDDFAGGLGEIEGLPQPVEVGEWAPLQGIADPLLVAGIVGHINWNAIQSVFSFA